MSIIGNAHWAAPWGGPPTNWFAFEVAMKSGQLSSGREPGELATRSDFCRREGQPGSVRRNHIRLAWDSERYSPGMGGVGGHY
jgi:hypothetical protein